MPDEYPQIQIMQQVGRTYRALLAAFDANIGQPMPRWRVLLMLHQQGASSQKKLASTLRMDPAALTRQIKIIEGLGWIARHNDVHDNRLVNVELTRSGHDVIMQALPRREAFIKRALSDLSSQELDTLGKMLGTLERRLKQETSSGDRQDS